MSKNKKLSLDFIRINRDIKNRLNYRFNEMALTRKDVCVDAREKGFIIQQSALSRYMSNEYIVPGSLTQEQILWLCCRYCIPLKLNVNKIEYSDEISSILLKKYFYGKRKV